MTQQFLKRGVENPQIIDLIFLDKTSNEVVLTILEPRAWGKADNQLYQLEDKYNRYLAYILEGFLGKEYPQYIGKKIRFEILCIEYPRGNEKRFLDAAQNYAKNQNMNFIVKVISVEEMKMLYSAL